MSGRPCGCDDEAGHVCAWHLPEHDARMAEAVRIARAAMSYRAQVRKARDLRARHAWAALFDLVEAGR